MALQVDPSFLVRAQAVDDVEKIQPRLDTIETYAVNSVLTQAVYKLMIIQNSLPDSDSAWEEYTSMAARMMKLQKLKLPEDTETNNVLFLKKLRRVCSHIRLVLKVTIRELYFHGTKNYLEYMLHVENAKYYDEVMLKTEYCEVNETIKSFTGQLSTVKHNFNETSFYLSDNMIGPCLEKAVVNSWATTQTALRHLDNTTQSRISQLNHGAKEKEDRLVHQTNDCVKKMQEDTVIDLDIENQLLAMISKLTHGLERWSAKYNEEIETLDVSLLQIKSKVDTQKEQYNALLETYRMKQEIVSELRVEADAREVLVELRRRQNKAASVIQSWWRAILFMRFIRARKMIRKMSTKKSSLKPSKKGTKPGKKATKPKKK